MKAIVDLVLPWPPSVNAWWVVTKNKQIVPSAAALEYKRRVAELCRARAPLSGRCEIEFIHYHPRFDSSDIDAPFKATFDSLNGVAWLDDNQVKKIREIEIFPPTRQPRVHLRIEAERFATESEVFEHARAKDARNRKRKATLAETNRRKRLKDLDASGVQAEARRLGSRDLRLLATSATYPRAR